MTSVMSTEAVTSVAAQVRQATEKSMQAWQQGTTTLTERVIALMTLPVVDPTRPVQLYLQNLQRTVDLQREMSLVWTDLLAQLSGSLRQRPNSLHKTPAENVNGEPPTALPSRHELM